MYKWSLKVQMTPGTFKWRLGRSNGDWNWFVNVTFNENLDSRLDLKAPGLTFDENPRLQA